MDKPEKKYKVIKIYPDTGKGKMLVNSLKLWCQLSKIQVEELPMFLMCVVKIPSLDINYDEAYRDLVERGYLALKEYKVPNPAPLL